MGRRRHTWQDNWLWFDIETVPNERLISKHMPEIKVSAPANYKDEEKIARYIEEKTQGKEEKFISGAPVDLDYAQIQSIGLAHGSLEPEALVVGEQYTSSDDPLGQGKFRTIVEVDVLVWFWEQANKAGVLSGYNIVGFDIPIIMRRSFMLGITPSRPLYGLKPWDKVIYDAMREFYHNGYGPGIKYRSLKHVCDMLEIKTPWDVDSEISGADVGDMSPEELRDYVISDVAKTRALVTRMKGHYH